MKTKEENRTRIIKNEIKKYSKRKGGKGKILEKLRVEWKRNKKRNYNI